MQNSPDDFQEQVGLLVNKANQVKNLDHINNLVSTIINYYADKTIGFWAKDGSLSITGEHWITIRFPNKRLTIEGEEVKVSLFGPPLCVPFRKKNIFTIMIAISVPESWKKDKLDNVERLLENLNNSDFKNILFNVAYLLNNSINETAGKMFVPLFPISPIKKTGWNILIPYVSSVSLDCLSSTPLRCPR